MKTKLTTVAIATSIIVSALIPTAVSAASVNEGQLMIPVIVDGQKVKFPDTEPYIDENGRTLVPVRFVSEKLGATVTWDANTQTATIKKDSKTIDLTIDSKDVKVNGAVTTLDTAAVLTDGRTMVPLRFVSETLATTVTWDDSARAVQVTGSSYKSKVDKGEVSLDAWGRELSKTWDAKWNLLTDTSKEFYDLPNYTDSYRWYTHKEFLKEVPQWTSKESVDGWVERVRKYYMTQLNVDYRTLNEEKFIADATANMQFASSYYKSQAVNGIKIYLNWVKENHIITIGYADPEPSSIYYVSLYPVIRTNFKFMIISADDTSQTFMDNTQVSKNSDSYPLNKGVWYTGYSDVALYTNHGNYQEQYFAVRNNENMFQKGHHHYELITE